MSDKLVIIITGTNRGIGKGIITLLAQQESERPLIIYATSRTGDDSGISPAAKNEIHHGKLDTTGKDSIKTLFDQVIKAHGLIDVLINNAAISKDNYEDPKLAAQVI
jgi:carbonyl reductase 1